MNAQQKHKLEREKKAKEIRDEAATMSLEQIGQRLDTANRRSVEWEELRFEKAKREAFERNLERRERAVLNMEIKERANKFYDRAGRQKTELIDTLVNQMVDRLIDDTAEWNAFIGTDNQKADIAHRKSYLSMIKDEIAVIKAMKDMIDNLADEQAKETRTDITSPHNTEILDKVDKVKRELGLIQGGKDPDQ